MEKKKGDELQQKQQGRVEFDDAHSQIPSPSAVVFKNEARLSIPATRVTFPALVSTRLANTKNNSNNNTPADNFIPGRERLPSLLGQNISVSDSTLYNESSSLGEGCGNSFLDMHPISSAGHSESEIDEEGKDARAMQDILEQAFPESLKHIAVDEAAVEAVLSNNTIDSGYHRQFTELILIDVHALLVRTITSYETRKRYLMRHSGFELDGGNSRGLESLITEDSVRSLSEWSESWYQNTIDIKNVLSSVTVRPPQFYAGMLWNGEDRFLLGGTAFSEEGRILQIKLQTSTVDSETSAEVTPSRRIGSASLSRCSNGPKTQVRFLLREYTSVSKLGIGCMVQTFSLIPDNVSINISRKETLPFALIKSLLDQCSPGAVTRAFSLQMLLPTNLRMSLDATLSEDATFSEACIRTLGRQGSIDLKNTLPLRSNNNNSLSVTCVDSMLSNTLMGTRSTKSGIIRRQPLGDEAYLRYTNPKLFALVMQHPPSLLTSHTNAIREYIYYSRRLRFRRLMKKLLHAVKVIQRFFRLSLLRKKRAVERMLTQWRQLEIDCREKLKKYTLPPTATERIGFIVSTVLWNQILTTDEYKKSMLKEHFISRRDAYRKWCVQRMEEEKEKLEISQRLNKITGNNEIEKLDTKIISKLMSSTYMASREINKKENNLTSDVKTSHYKWISKYEDVIRARFGWYIDPEELLQESHRRMLLSLRSSVLTMAEVEAEFKKRGDGGILSLI